MKERRKYTRLVTKEKTALNKNGDSSGEGVLLDISPGGMKILLDRQTQIGSIISGQFKIIPNIGPFYVQGEVTWVNPIKETKTSGSCEIGVKFNKISTIPI